MAPDRLKGKKVMVATMALGNRCLNIMVRLETPSARAAKIQVKFRPRKNSALTTPTSPIQLNSNIINSSVKKPGIKKLERMMSMKSSGRPLHISMKRWKNRSTLPPKYPCQAPAEIPMTVLKTVSTMPNTTEMRNPQISLATTSRP